ncbi:hypothetical protein DK37_26680 [Halomonas sp. SUBG004]|nr:hypothetical protein DK37_26680 [Halomonas sp. SUBG004]
MVETSQDQEQGAPLSISEPSSQPSRCLAGGPMVVAFGCWMLAKSTFNFGGGDRYRWLGGVP